MEDDSLPENQKISEKNSFLENIMNRNTRIQRYDKRLNTFTSSMRLVGKRFNYRGFKQSPKSRNSFRKKTLHSNLFIYNKSSTKLKNLKLNGPSNISPTISTYENEKEIIENEKMKHIHQKIYNIYNSYYKAYKNNTKNKDNEIKKTENEEKKKKRLYIVYKVHK